MNYLGIIAEYNPFHSGHAHHIAQSRTALEGETTVIVIMSGHWTQQAHCAILDKWTRARLALEGGADLILELPTPWATSSAEGFARGAVYLLESTGLATHLSFGSEGGDINALQTMAQGLKHPAFSPSLKKHLLTGVSFPMARERALTEVLGEDSAMLQMPNNILGLEYLLALDYFKSKITPMTIQRQGGGFHSIAQPMQRPVFTSATDLRSKLTHGVEREYLTHYLSPEAIGQLEQADYPSLKQGERIILAKLCTMTVEEWSALPFSGAEEGLPHRLHKIGQSVSSIEDFFEKAKTKRFTHSRLRRLLLHAVLGITAEHIPKTPNYARVLGFNPKGSFTLKQMKKTATLPILTKTAQVHHLAPEVTHLFQKEVAYTDIYGLCFPKIKARGLEWTQSPVRTKSPVPHSVSKSF